MEQEEPLPLDLLLLLYCTVMYCTYSTYLVPTEGWSYPVLCLLGFSRHPSAGDICLRATSTSLTVSFRISCLCPCLEAGIVRFVAQKSPSLAAIVSVGPSLAHNTAHPPP